MENRNWSGLRNTYTILYVDGSEQVIKSALPDVVRWERQNKAGYLEKGTPSAEQMLWTAWAAGKRTQLIEQGITFNEWLPRVVDFAIHDDDENGDTDDRDPTPPDHSAE